MNKIKNKIKKWHTFRVCCDPVSFFSTSVVVMASVFRRDGYSGSCNLVLFIF